MVALANDGGFKMTMSDLETTQRGGTNFVFCVFDVSANPYET
jgi:thiamine pyrophosphate-dependent acetolactate synthase large subunit-like protein